MPVTAVRLTRSRNGAGELVVRLGVPLLDEYLEFLAGRRRPNTVLAVAYDLKVFFTAVGKQPGSQPRPAPENQHQPNRSDQHVRHAKDRG